MPESGSSRRWSVWLTKKAQEDLDHLERRSRETVTTHLRGLESDPLPPGKAIKKLQGTPRPTWRLRVGDFRVLYRIDGLRVLVLRIVDRQDLERVIASL